MKNIKNIQKFDYKKGGHVIQGDVILHLESFPLSDQKHLNTDILQMGNTTGHSHQLVGGKYQMLEDNEGNQYLNVLEPTTLVHEEHNAIELPVGTYRKSIQLEKDWITDTIREVQD